MPTSGRHFNAADATEVRKAAEETAGHGAALAEKAGFSPQPVAIEGAPTWRGILDVAEAHQASLIVLGSHRRSGLGHLLGSVAAAVTAHSSASVLVVHGRS